MQLVYFAAPADWAKKTWKRDWNHRKNRDIQTTALLRYICLCLPPDRTWHKVNDPKVDYSGDLGEGEGQARAEAMLVIGPPSAMWAWWA